jgi:SRSO17 transposase
MDGGRKSIEPLAERIAGADVQSLRQFVGQSPWAVEQIQQRLAEKVADLMAEPEVWMIDETSFPKAGEASVGVARQYCGALGKVANCQVAVSLHWSTCEASCPLAWRLYLPQSWLETPARRAEGKIPDDIRYRSKNQLALELIDQVLSWDVPRLPVVADSAYGNDFDFRAALRERGLQYAVAVEPSIKVWTTDPDLVPLAANKPTGRPREYPALKDLPEAKTSWRRSPRSCPRRLGAVLPGAKEPKGRCAPGLLKSKFGRLMDGSVRNIPSALWNGCWLNGRKMPQRQPTIGWRNWASNPWGCGV